MHLEGGRLEDWVSTDDFTYLVGEKSFFCIFRKVNILKTGKATN